MKNLGNIFRVMALMSAGVLLFGARAHAAAKPGKKPLTVEVKKVTKVEKITLNHLPLGASGPSGTPKPITEPGDKPLRGFSMEGIHKADPNPPDMTPGACSVESIRQTDPTKFNGYFMKRYVSVQNVQNPDGPKGISPETDLAPQPLEDEIMTHHFRKLEIFLASDKIDPSFLPGP